MPATRMSWSHHPALNLRERSLQIAHPASTGTAAATGRLADRLTPTACRADKTCGHELRDRCCGIGFAGREIGTEAQVSPSLKPLGHLMADFHHLTVRFTQVFVGRHHPLHDRFKLVSSRRNIVASITRIVQQMLHSGESSVDSPPVRFSEAVATRRGEPAWSMK